MSSRKSTFFFASLIAFVSVVVGMVIASRLDLAPRSFADALDVPATNSAPLSGPIDATTFRIIAREASPSVVSIFVLTTRPASQGNFFDFEFPFGPFGPQGGGRGDAPREQRVPGAGSGFIIDKDGFILTNNHVVEDATSIEVRLSTMGELEPGLPAKLVGRDELTDTALIQLTELPRAALVASKFGDSDQMAPGDWVMAIGNPFQLSNTVTVGVVSAVGRETRGQFIGRGEQMIQTDAAINRGNSGGPLLNLRGEVIGINTMIVSDQGGGNVGVGFAVPINTVRDLLPKLREGKVVRGRIGVQVDRRPITAQDAEDLGLPTTAGAEVTQLTDGPAKAAGVRVGDVIVEYNGRPVQNSNDLVAMVTRTTPGTTVPVKVIREKKSLTLNVTVAELDLELEQSAGGTPRSQGQPEAPQETGFGMSVRPIQPREQRELQVPSGRGVIVDSVESFSPAAQAGVQPGDVIVSIQAQPIRTVQEATGALEAVPAGRTARVIVWRNGQEVLLQVRKR
jgi:serine protease Do